MICKDFRKSAYSALVELSLCLEPPTLGQFPQTGADQRANGNTFYLNFTFTSTILPLVLAAKKLRRTSAVVSWLRLPAKIVLLFSS